MRRQIVEVILQAREKDMQAAEHIRRGLEKWGEGLETSEVSERLRRFPAPERLRKCPSP